MTHPPLDERIEALRSRDKHRGDGDKKACMMQAFSLGSYPEKRN